MPKMAEKVTSPHISKITDYLYLSAFPRGEHVAEIIALGVRLVLSMHWMRPTKMLGKPHGNTTHRCVCGILEYVRNRCVLILDTQSPTRP